MQPQQLPTRIDEPHQYLLWSSDELIPIMTLFCLGIMIDQLTIMVLIGYVLSRLLRRYKDSRPEGYLLHAVYWGGLVKDKGLTWINPFRRQWFA